MASTMASAKSCPCAMAAKGLRLATLEGSARSAFFCGRNFSKPGGETELAVTLRGGASDARSACRRHAGGRNVLQKRQRPSFFAAWRRSGRNARTDSGLSSTLDRGFGGPSMRIHLALPLLALGYAFASAAVAEPIPYSKTVQ